MACNSQPHILAPLESMDLDNASKLKLPFGLPPILSSLEDSLEDMLKCPEKLPINQLEHQQRLVLREPDIDSLFSVELAPLETTIAVRRDTNTGQLLGYGEEHIKEKSATSKNSFNMGRAPGKLTEGIRGSSANYPFWPGGMDYPAEELQQSNELFDSAAGYETVPPGMEAGIDFSTKTTEMTDLNQPTIGIDAILQMAHFLDDVDEDLSSSSVDGRSNDEVPPTNGPLEPLQDVRLSSEEINADDFDALTKPLKVLDIKDMNVTLPKVKDTEWAIGLDMNTPVENFYEEIPDMAYTWPFELDIFQKQAILHLERHQNVFIAAHTSAGKTVVAEYAIALSMKHRTRTIYTSPIKALSNQKFHDFKTTFDDVGLVTGDIQINQTASCLIMTTEILRSMLYGGSDVIRDLEYVVFDEVHYINNVERGVVWEEVLIMLPPHVNIILLSATVPNCMEFADWVGRTKKSKVYVISTPKRPVPLEHFLYTGNNAKTSSELFLLVDSAGQLQQSGYRKAMEAKKERASKASQTTGAKGPRHGLGPNQDKSAWLSAISMLKKTDKLPAVAFVFSKKKIDEFSHYFLNQDLTTSSEKSAIHVFFTKAISKLKGSDQELPQVTHLQSLLKKGIGIHHSGVLPIIKEIVEMLFQKGLIKILFATETFAMGVNMPARTVIFDCLRKYDGTAPRNLKPGEYTQMAGRAGRRGLDKTGTVIILCKGDVPELSDLHQITQGKPGHLESHFRLTYSMILNLLRVEKLKIEDMLKRSFSELSHQKNSASLQEKVEQLAPQVQGMDKLGCLFCDESILGYYKLCKTYTTQRRSLLRRYSTHPSMGKTLQPNRVVYVNRPNTIGKYDIGLILHVSTVKDDKVYRCLVLSNLTESDYPGPSKLRPVIESVVEPPSSAVGHVVTVFKVDELAAVSPKVLKHSCDVIINNYEQRKLPRFRDNPPGQSVLAALSELNSLALAPMEQPSFFEESLWEAGRRDMESVELLMRLKDMKKLLAQFECLNCSQFSVHFKETERNSSLMEELEQAQYDLSDQSLELLPEYHSRVLTLEMLGYISPNKRVKMKGQVACEISQHEILITQLILENVFNDCNEQEIAALLSCMVFEQKRCSQANLTPFLERKTKEIVAIATSFAETQKANGVLMAVDEYVGSLRFELTEVVYEWAKGTSFCAITSLTDAQEGIIVRTIQRLEELLRDVRNAAKIIGNQTLYKKMEDASTAIKRDIVFAASLYTQ